jgi:hypothetical protein
MNQSMKRYPGLYREDRGSEGSRFRILINHDKKIIQEYFYFGSTCSEPKARKYAIARWRELREIYPVITRRRFREIPRRPTDSGITGVTRIIHKVKGHEYLFWKAVWTTIRGAKRSKMFSVNKYGEKEAKELAVRARQDALDKIGVE